MLPSTNYFGYQTAAQRYARGRPFFHALVMDKIKEIVPLAFPVANALDVGCGTGQSTVALRTIADSVIGVDASPEMLSVAVPGDNIRYLPAPAEQIPLPDAVFDLITVSLAFHWFGRTRFFSEAHRLLRDNGWLVVYNNAFRGEMRDTPVFAHWLTETFLKRYPTPARNNVPVTDPEAADAGFAFAHRENYENEIVFTPEELVAYLMTQSNVIAAVEQGSEDIETIYEQTLQEVEPMFAAQQGTFLFGGYIWYLQKQVC